MGLDAPELQARLSRIPFGPSLWLVPVRHHSPACALQLQVLIRRVKPRRILIEGPADATPLIPHLAARDARPPLAIYCYHTSAETSGAELCRYRSYLPFADFSPEWVAIREGARLGAELRFIDLPYGARIGLSEQHKEELFGEEHSLAADRLLQESWATGRVVELGGCRDFNEWWDRHFESTLRDGRPDDFFRQLQQWCLMLRPDGDAGDEETVAREHAMATAVREAQADDGPCLVVTGGYHCEGIARLLADEEIDSPTVTLPDGERGNYLIPYSLSRLDAANGYAASMADVSYYQALWRQRRQGEPHDEAIRLSAVRVARRMRQRGEPLGLPDILEAATLAHRLAALRGCHAGRSELFDAMESVYFKDVQYQPRAWRRRLRELASEALQGHTPQGYPIAPLVMDFRLNCKRLRLPSGAAKERLRRLDIYRSRQHREVSRLLHQLRFLGIPYATLEAGPDFANGSGLDRVVEAWQLRWRPETDAILTERSVYGGQLREAALNYLGERLESGDTDPATLLLAALQMGLRGLIDSLLERLSDWLGRQGDFVILVAGLRRIHQANHTPHLLEMADFPALQRLLEQGFDYCCRRLTWLGEMEPERDSACAEALGVLNSLAQPDAPWCKPSLFHDSLSAIADSRTRARSHAAPTVTGRAAGILVARSFWPRERGVAAIEGALRQAEGEPAYLGAYLNGFLPAARSLLLQEPSLVAAISRTILNWDEAMFMMVLPHLRLAFTGLRPRESATLAQMMMQMLGGSGEEPPQHWSDTELERLRRLHHDTREALLELGVMDAE